MTLTFVEIFMSTSFHLFFLNYSGFRIPDSGFLVLGKPQGIRQQSKMGQKLEFFVNHLIKVVSYWTPLFYPSIISAKKQQETKRTYSKSGNNSIIVNIPVGIKPHCQLSFSHNMMLMNSQDFITEVTCTNRRI